MRHKGWKLPDNTSVIHPPLPSTWRQCKKDHSSASHKADELVFISGPEYHKGLTLLCDALDKVTKEPDVDLMITMISPFGRILGEHTGGMLLRRARAWPFRIKFLPWMSPRECLSYLHRPGALAVFPAHAASTNLWMAACLEHSLPFVATNVGSAAELVSMESQPKCLSEPAAGPLADRIIDAVRKGIPSALPNIRWTVSNDAWSRQFATIAVSDEVKQAPSGSVAAPNNEPLVSVVLVHHDRPKYLLQAIGSIEQQDYPNLELILVDDGSTLSESRSTLESLESRFANKGWRILREANRYLGAARNTGVRAARGAYILFLDDDNALFRSAISTLVRAARSCGADICTCFRKTIYDESIPPDEREGFIQYLALGGSLDIGFIENSFGDATALIRREVFDAIGSQIELFGRTGEDWEFYARALLEGLKLRLVPEALYWYRSSVHGMLKNSHWYDNRQPTLETFRQHGFQGLEYLYHLALSSHVRRSEVDRLYDNLVLFSPWDTKLHELGKLEPQSSEAIELLADIASGEGRAETAFDLRKRGQNHDLPADPADTVPDRRARRSTGSRTLECSPKDFARARLGVSYPSELPPLLFPREGGLFLRPSSNGPVTAVLDEGFPPFARRAIGHVEIAHAEASPFDFAMALTRSDHMASWSSDIPENCVAFSGWRRVEDRFKLQEIVLEIKHIATIFFTLNLAIRLPPASNASPSNAFWRKLVFEWDE
jgi:GT2 family glycosyltransferase